MRFGTAGIRGVIGRDFDERFAYKLGVCLARTFCSEFVVGHDGRRSSKSLYGALISGLTSCGSKVYSLGLSSTPYLCYSVKELGGYGVMITASHNPPEYNGFKVIGPNGRDLFREEEEEIEKSLERYSPPTYRYSRLEARDLREEYLEEVISFVERKLGRVEQNEVIYDGANGTASLFTLKALSALGHKVISFNDHVSGEFPGRLPEPSEENVERYVKLAGSYGFPYFGQDGDGDRTAFGINGKYVIEDKVMGAIVKALKLKGRIVLAINTSSSLWRELRKIGAEVEIWKLGYLHERLREGTSFISEPWKYMFPEFGPWFDGTLATCLISSCLTGFSKALREVKIGERENWNFKFEGDRKKVFEHVVNYLERNLEIKEVIKIDGVRFEFDGGWILVRLSGTEPKIRFYAEARNREELEEIKRGVMQELKRICGGREWTHFPSS